ncbi:MAG TPA: HD domain-containing protein [Spirochaetota bacterium]|nr:HD domain-containing protein [Spirochaetota bacterium]
MWDQKLYQKAIDFAANAHLNQLVPGKKYQYTVHICNVAQEIMRSMFEEKFENPDLAIQCALLHDTLEDTSVEEEQLEIEFGKDVLSGVKALTKNKTLEKKKQMIDSLERIMKLGSPIASVKLADRITNLQIPPSHWNLEKKQNYLEEAKLIHTKLSKYNNYLGNRLLQCIKNY